MHLFYCFVDSNVELANWDSGKTREKLQRDSNAHISSVRDAKLAELKALHEVHPGSTLN